MWTWNDVGIVLSSKNHGEKYKIIDVFTKRHGKFAALYQASKVSSFSIFSKVDIDYLSRNETSLGFWKLKNEKQNWIYLLNSGSHLLVCQGICFLLNKALPHALPHKNLFNFAEYIADNIQKFSEREVLSLYAYFEFVLLENAGFGLDLGEQNTDVSELWKLWKRHEFTCDASRGDIKNSLENTGNAIERNISHLANNHFRMAICRLV
ncbi:MAG: recombination protein O N-terminal domain-containing protein [Holosporales bacterium]|jgi:recombinational DNA repair protein (RecF pathway)|nr:recombination protein O N-terminal domain-containing protein [Holosporales bacterium]